MYHPTDRITHTTVFVRPVVENWMEREIAQWVHHDRSIRRSIKSDAMILSVSLNKTFPSVLPF